MKDISVIFDFNGTMIFDKKYHDEAWRRCMQDLVMKDISDVEAVETISGRTPYEIISHYIGCEPTEGMVIQFSEEKERIYRSLLLKSEKKPKLAPGLVRFLNYLREAKIDMAIATTASLQNMMLYHEMFNLEQWFDWDYIFFDDGNTRLKPDPELYLKAIKKLDTPANHILAFEDSISGIKSAYCAGIKNIINVRGDLLGEGYMSEPGVMAVIKDFTELNENNFK